MYHVHYCSRCAKTGANMSVGNDSWTKVDFFGAGYLHISDVEDEDGVIRCDYCGSTDLVDTLITSDDYAAILWASDCNRELLEAMIELRKKDVVEYEIKMSQLRIQAENVKDFRRKQREEKKRKPKPVGSGLTFWWGHRF